MRQLRHWTLRYIANRIAWYFYERRNMDKPWLTPRSTEILSTLLLPTDLGVEWGSGRSTLWLAGRLNHLTSIEDSKDWYSRIKQRLSNEDITNVTYHYAPPPPENREALASEYIALGCAFPDDSLGLALVDGSAREYCAEAIIPKIAPAGVLVVDNANWYLDHPTHSPYSRVGRGPANEAWSQLDETLSQWRLIWTSNGVWDTAIYIKPAVPGRARF